MKLRKIIMPVIAVFLTANLMANDDVNTSENLYEKCEASYVLCMEQCELKTLSENVVSHESCFDQCELTYEKCMQEDSIN